MFLTFALTGNCYSKYTIDYCKLPFFPPVGPPKKNVEIVIFLLMHQGLYMNNMCIYMHACNYHIISGSVYITLEREIENHIKNIS